LYLEHAVWVEIRGAVELATYISWQGERKSDASSGDNVLLLRRSVWGEELKPHLEGLGLQVRLVPTFVPGLKAVARSVAGLVRVIVSSLLNPGVRRIAVSRSSGGPTTCGSPRVSVQYTRSTDPTERNDLYWFEGSGLRPEDVVVCFESAAYPVSSEELSKLQKRGFGYALRAKSALLDGDAPLWQKTPLFDGYRLQSAGAALRMLPGMLSHRVRRWEWMNLVRLMYRVDSWQDFYESTGTRVDVSQADNPVEPAIALDNLGGVTVGVQYTMGLVSPVYPQLVFGNQILFCWGSAFAETVSKRALRPDTLILSGYLFDRYRDPAKAQAKIIRQSLADAGAKFVVALFDVPASGVRTSAEVLESFYSSFLQMCLDDSTFGLVIKPKRNDAMERLSRLQELFAAARSTGRCLILEDPQDERRLAHNKNPVFPMVAALASDLAVNMLSTAGMEAVLVGIPCVHYDPWRDTGPPNDLFYKCDGAAPVVFQDLDDLTSAIDRHRTTVGARDGLGDHRRIIDQIDPFRDGRAGQRIGRYIGLLVEKLGAGLPREQAVAEANTQYAETWGADKINVSTRQPLRSGSWSMNIT
jgi:hypothetical protein